MSKGTGVLAELREGLERELVLYRRLRWLADESLRVVGEEGGRRNLLPVLEEKIRLLREVRELQEELRQSQEAWHRLGTQRSAEDLVELERKTGELERLLRETIAKEAEVDLVLRMQGWPATWPEVAGAGGGGVAVPYTSRAADPGRLLVEG